MWDPSSLPKISTDNRTSYRLMSDGQTEDTTNI